MRSGGRRATFVCARCGAAIVIGSVRLLGRLRLEPLTGTFSFVHGADAVDRAVRRLRAARLDGRDHAVLAYLNHALGEVLLELDCRCGLTYVQSEPELVRRLRRAREGGWVELPARLATPRP